MLKSRISVKSNVLKDINLSLLTNKKKMLNFNVKNVIRKDNIKMEHIVVCNVNITHIKNAQNAQIKL